MSESEGRGITGASGGPRRLAGILVTAVAMAACVVAVVNVFGPAPHDARPEIVAAASSPQAAVALPTCGGATVDSPLTVTLWCTSPQQLDNLSWSGWGSRTASATGDLRDTTCFCVGAPTKQFPVVVRLVDPAGSKRYSELSLSFPAARPAWAYLPSFRFVWTPEGYVSEDSAS